MRISTVIKDFISGNSLNKDGYVTDGSVLICNNQLVATKDSGKINIKQPLSEENHIVARELAVMLGYDYDRLIEQEKFTINIIR